MSNHFRVNVIVTAGLATGFPVCGVDSPLDAFSRGGRPPTDTQDQNASRAGEADEDDADAQQRLNAVAEDGDDDSQMETWRGDTADESVDAEPATLLSELTQEDGSGELDGSLRSEVDDAIESLESLQSTLE